MNPYTLAAVVCVSWTALGALLAVLRHLAAMRPTSGELAAIRASSAAHEETTEAALERARLKLEELDTKLTHLKNRLG